MTLLFIPRSFYFISVVFTKPLEDKHCIEGDSITFTCEVNLENLPGKWKKDGQKLEPSESLNISVDGRIHKLDLNSVTVYDSGEYTCYIKNKNSFLRLTVSEGKSYFKIYIYYSKGKQLN